jgi:hypothetical protein
MPHKKDLLLGSEQWRDRALYQFPFFQWFSLDGSTRWHELFGAHEIVMYMLNLSSLLKVQGHSQGFALPWNVGIAVQLLRGGKPRIECQWTSP